MIRTASLLINSSGMRNLAIDGHTAFSVDTTERKFILRTQFGAGQWLLSGATYRPRDPLRGDSVDGVDQAEQEGARPKGQAPINEANTICSGVQDCCRYT